MEYYFTFLFITWWGGEHMRVDHHYFVDESTCVVEQNEIELALNGQAEASDGKLSYIVGDCELVVNPKPEEEKENKE